MKMRLCLFPFLLMALVTWIRCENSPSDAVNQLFTASEDKDVDRFKKAFSKKTLEYFDTEWKQGRDMGTTYSTWPRFMLNFHSPKGVNIIKEEIQDDATASVIVNFKSQRLRLPIVKEDGKWKVDLTDPLKPKKYAPKAEKEEKAEKKEEKKKEEGEKLEDKEKKDDKKEGEEKAKPKMPEAEKPAKKGGKLLE